MLFLLKAGHIFLKALNFKEVFDNIKITASFKAAYSEEIQRESF